MPGVSATRCDGSAIGNPSNARIACDRCYSPPTLRIDSSTTRKVITSLLFVALVIAGTATGCHAKEGSAANATSEARAPAKPRARMADGTAPRLVLLLVIDQLRRDRLSDELPGGLGRIAREGRVYSDSALAHAISETCPGHVTLLTGRYPGHAGIPSNVFVSRDDSDRFYCVEDREEEGKVHAGRDDPEAGRSPRNIRVDGLTDWLKARHTASRVMSVSGKDRAAIASVGKGADVAWWFLKPYGFSTSAYYMDALPGWVREWNGQDPGSDGLLRGIPETWIHRSAAPGPFGRKDDFSRESSVRSRVSGHPLRSSDPDDFFNNVYRSPFLDQVTLEFAWELIQRENLGGGEAPDLLTIALSATDLVGHDYGPESHEARDALERLDEDLGAFLQKLEERVGKQNLLIVLTADHGVLQLPGWLVETGRSACPVDGGVAGLKMLAAGLLFHMHNELGPTLSIPRKWISFSGSGITISREAVEQSEHSLAEIAEVASRYLEEQDAVARVWSEAEILNEASETAELYRRSFDPERSGDLLIQIEPTCLIRPKDYGTTHGSPHLYDRAVPLVFMGPGVKRGKVEGRAETVDIGPTLARHLGIAVPDGLDGRALDLAAEIAAD